MVARQSMYHVPVIGPDGLCTACGRTRAMHLSPRIESAVLASIETRERITNDRADALAEVRTAVYDRSMR